MKKVLGLFILMFTLFIPYVDAAIVDYEFRWFKYLGNKTTGYLVNDVLETDDGYLMLTYGNIVYIYDKEGNQVGEKEVGMKPTLIIKTNEKNYVISHTYSDDEDTTKTYMDIGTLNMDGTITDIKQLNISGNSYFYMPTGSSMSIVRGNYLYVIGPYDYLRISADLSTGEVIAFENANDEDKENIGDILYVMEQGYNLIGVHDGGIVYSYDDNSKFVFYKDGKEVWTTEIENVDSDVSITTHKENLLMSLIIQESDYTSANKILIINENGKIIGETEIETYLNNKFGSNLYRGSYRLYGMTDGFLVADAYYTLSETYVENENLRTDEDPFHPHYFIMYIEGVEDEVKDENVPETSDNISSYIVLLLGSILGVASINSLKNKCKNGI